jgi:NTE family protein
MSVDTTIPKIQRALVLQGGGTLGAYEAGVISVLCNYLREEDERNGAENRLLFDIVAGTSIGAMNGTILVSQFLETQSWEKAAEKVQRFWTKQLSLKRLDITELSKPWYDEWLKRNPTAASEESARRYYAVKKLLSNQVRNNMYYQCVPPIEDDKFFDNQYNSWPLHSSKPLQESIEKYTKFPISTDRKNRQPRLLVFSVDVSEGITVTFDSYPKVDGSRKSEYGNYEEGRGYENVINYNDGINIKHVMASGTLSEFYDYAPIPTSAIVEQKNQGEGCLTDKSDKTNIRYFWDGGLLSNTPLRELLQAHQEYWHDVENKDKIPDLDIYIVNVHPPKMNIGTIPEDHDGVLDRNNDIIFGDRTSHYDERIANLIANYANFATQIKGLADVAISKINDKNNKEELSEKLGAILATKIIDKERKGKARKYEDLMRDRFKLGHVMRIERTNYINSIYFKTGDLTFETINKLIKEGECDALFSLIHKDIKELDGGVGIDTRSRLLDKLNEAMRTFRKNDYEDINSQTYRTLTEFIDILKEKLKTDLSDKLMKLADRLRDNLD